MTTTNETASAIARNHEVHVQAMVKALTAQRDSANNSIVIGVAEKAVLEDRLKRYAEKLSAVENALAASEAETKQVRSELSAARIIILNLESQLKSQLNSDANVEIQADVESLEEQLEEKTNEQQEKSLVARVIDRCLPSRS